MCCWWTKNTSTWCSICCLSSVWFHSRSNSFWSYIWFSVHILAVWMRQKRKLLGLQQCTSQSKSSDTSLARNRSKFHFSFLSWLFYPKQTAVEKAETRKILPSSHSQLGDNEMEVSNAHPGQLSTERTNSLRSQDNLLNSELWVIIYCYIYLFIYLYNVGHTFRYFW